MIHSLFGFVTTVPIISKRLFKIFKQIEDSLFAGEGGC